MPPYVDASVTGSLLAFLAITAQAASTDAYLVAPLFAAPADFDKSVGTVRKISVFGRPKAWATCLCALATSAAVNDLFAWKRLSNACAAISVNGEMTTVPPGLSATA